jgi:hypothetical protein
MRLMKNTPFLLADPSENSVVVIYQGVVTIAMQSDSGLK